jgi:hypothetical protein
VSHQRPASLTRPHAGLIPFLLCKICPIIALHHQSLLRMLPFQHPHQTTPNWTRRDHNLTGDK